MHVFSAEIMSNYISVAYFGYRKDEERACRSCRRESECKTASTINSCTKMVLVTFLITCNKLESKGKAPRHSPNLFWSKKLNNLPLSEGLIFTVWALLRSSHKRKNQGFDGVKTLSFQLLLGRWYQQRNAVVTCSDDYAWISCLLVCERAHQGLGCWKPALNLRLQ